MTTVTSLRFTLTAAEGARPRLWSVTRREPLKNDPLAKLTVSAEVAEAMLKVWLDGAPKSPDAREVSELAEVLRAVIEAEQDGDAPDRVEVVSPRPLVRVFERVGFTRRDEAGETVTLRLERSGRLDAPARVGVGMSGGGIRAAGHAFGVLKGLRAVGLDERVKVITAVSGGCITAALYAVGRAQRRDFEEISRVIEGALRDEPVAVDDEPEASLPRRVADVVDAHLKRLTPNQTSPALKGLCTAQGVNEVVFQSCELTRSGAFVFAASTQPRQNFGPQCGGATPSRRLTREDIEGLRVADAVAASACFPVGIEPFVFPYAFSGGAAWLEARREGLNPEHRAWFEAGVPLVDGGVYDNQGIDALIKTIQRRGTALDWLVVADAERPEADVSLTLKARPVLAVVGLVVLTAALVTATVRVAWNPRLPFELLLIAGLAVALALALPLLIDRYGAGYFPDAIVRQGLLRGSVVDAVEARVRTAVVLLLRTFMRRIRSQNYEHLLGRERHDDAPVFRRRTDATAALLTDLDDYAPGVKLSGARTRQRALQRVFKASAGLTAAVRRAQRVRTTLKLHGPDERVDDLLRVGEATLLVKLISWLETTPRVRTPEARALLERAHREWARVAETVPPPLNLPSPHH